jgi:hypothetical protein
MKDPDLEGQKHTGSGSGSTKLAGTKTILKSWKPGLFVNSGQFPCSWIRIRISKNGSGSRRSKSMRVNEDPDPIHGQQLYYSRNHLPRLRKMKATQTKQKSEKT